MAVAFRAGSAVNLAQTLTTTNTLALSIAQATVSGNSLVIAVSSASARTVSTVTDSAGNVWNLIKRQANGSSATTELWGVLQAKSLAIGNTVTVTCSGNGRFTCDLGEYSGISAFGATSGNTGTTSPTTTGAVAVEAAGDFLISAFGANANNTWTATVASPQCVIRGQVGTTSTHGALVDITGATSLTNSATMTADTWATASVDAKSTVVTHEEADSWWSGAQNSFASVALAAALAITATLSGNSQTVTTAHQDDPIYTGGGGVAFSQGPWPYQTRYIQSDADAMVFAPSHPLDEDYWQNQTPPVPATLGPLYLPDPEEIPARTLRGVAEEDYWQLGPPAVQATLGRLYYWDSEDVPPLRGQPDEDYWQNQVNPVPATLRYPEPSVFDEQYPVLSGLPDELYWQNPVAPVPFTLYQPLPLTDTDQYPFLHGTLEEDFWQPPVTAAPTYQNLLLWPDSDIPQQPAAFVPDEDLWQPPYQQPSYQYSIYLPDADQFAPGPVLPVFEDEPWVTFQQTVAIANIGLPVWAFEGDLVVTPGPPPVNVLDERISYDRYGAGEYLTGYIQIGNDL